MQKNPHSSSNKSFLTFTLVDNDGPLDGEWNTESWDQFLCNKFRGVAVYTNGYNFNDNSGVHTVRLLDNGNPHLIAQYAKQVNAWLDGSEQLPDCAPENIDLERSRIYPHINDLFDSLRQSDFALNCKPVYGDPRIRNQYLTSLQSQKYIQPAFDQSKSEEFTVILAYNAEPELFGDVVDSFTKSLKTLALMKVNLCEAYQSLLHEPDGDIDQLLLVILQYQLSDSAKYPDRVQLKLEQIVQEKAKACNMGVLPKLGIDWLAKQWNTKCYMIQRVRGMGELYQKFTDQYDTQHIVYKNVIESTEVKSTSSTMRQFFCFSLHTAFNNQAMDELDKKLRELCEGFNRIAVYHSAMKNTIFMCIYTDKGLNRQWFTQESRGGAKLFEQVGIIVKQLQYTEESKFFNTEQLTSTLYGDTHHLLAHLQSLFVQNQSQPDKPDGMTKKQVIQQFYDGLRSKKYKSVMDFRDEHAENCMTLAVVTKCDKTLEDLVNQFVRLSYCKLPEKSCVDSLREYVQAHPLGEKEVQLTASYLSDLKLYEVLDAIYRVVIQAKVQKLGTIILHGAPNSGKSSIMRIMNQIFICDYMLQTQGNFDMVPKLNEYKFQVVLSEETNFQKLLKESHLDNTKLFFERGGKPVEAKGKQAAWLYKGAANILASQYFPVNILESLNRDAISTRCMIVELKQSHTLSDTFPINAKQVARWLLDRYEEDNKVNEVYDEITVDIEEPTEQTQDLDLTFEQPRMILQQAPLLGKRKPQQKSQFNSAEQEKRTKREIEWKGQETLDKFTEEQTLQSEYNKMKPKLQYYYRGKCFPYQLIHKIFHHQFREREFCYYTIVDDKEKWTRQVALSNPIDIKTLLADNAPYAVYSGAVYEKPVIAYESLKEAKVAFTDLAFDVDMDSYDDLRTCCSGKEICDECWGAIIVPVVELIDRVMKESYGFKVLLWTFSGGRGVHLRVFDHEARTMDLDKRNEVLQAVKAAAFLEDVTLKLDEGVTKDMKRVLRLPFSVHCGSKMLVVPFDPAKVREFKVSEVPTLQKATVDSSAVDKYCKVLKDIFFPQIVKSLGSVLKLDQYKSDERNPYINENTPIENSSYEDIWQLISQDINKYKSKLFWFQVRSGMLQHNDRLEMMKYFKVKGVTRERCEEFFKLTMPVEKYCDSDNKIKELINWVYNKYTTN